MRRARLLWIAVATMTIVVTSGCSPNDDVKRRSSEQPPSGSAAVGTGGAGATLKDDGDFARDVAMKNMAAIELSRIALAKATSQQIKSFAQTVIDDHSAAGDKLKSVLSERSISWPAQLDGKHRETADELANKQGVDFEHDYVKAMVEGHQDLAAKLESRLDVQSVADWKTAAAGRTHTKAMPEPHTAMRDVQVRPAKSDSGATMKVNQWAADTYPIAQKHLDTARTLENATKKRSTE